MKKYGRPTAERSAALTGGCRLGWVRVEMGASGPVCHVVSTNRRRLVVQPVPLVMATALIARGVPSVFRHPSFSRPVSPHT